MNVLRTPWKLALIPEKGFVIIDCDKNVIARIEGLEIQKAHVMVNAANIIAALLEGDNGKLEELTKLMVAKI